MKKIYDVAVFGGGVVGASIFNALARCGHRAILIEKYDICSGATKANSAIVHAGFDAKENSLKAKYNVLGNKMYPSLCRRLGVPLKRIGAYVLGNDLEKLQGLYTRGIKNGLDKSDLEIKNRTALSREITALSHDVNYGLFAKNSYIVNPFLLNICLVEEGIVNGGECKRFFDTKRITKENNLFKIETENDVIYAQKIVNACGWGYNDIAVLLGEDTLEITFRRGEYFVLDNTQKFANYTLFPLPDKMGKGALVSPTVDGNTLIGPTASDSENLTKTTKDALNSLKQRSNYLITNIDLRYTIREYAGIRTIVGDDFVIEKSKKDGNVINIAGICSPGLTSAPAIALDIVKMLNLSDKVINSKKIEPYFLAKDLSEKKYNELVSHNPLYGNIICKCEMITEGDIINCLSRPLECDTVDGVKRRVRAGMGRCQGGFCMDKVAKIIAKHKNLPLDKILKEYPNGNIFAGDIKGV